MTKGFLSRASLERWGRDVLGVVGRIGFSPLKCVFAGLMRKREHTLLTGFAVRFSAMGVISRRWAISYITMIIDVHGCGGKTVGLSSVYTAQGRPHLGGGKSHLVVCGGKVSRLLSSELDSVAKFKFSIVVNARTGKTVPPQPCPMEARISGGTS